MCAYVRPTVVSVSGEVLHVNDEVVVCVQFPELAVDDVEVLVGEIVCDLREREEGWSAHKEGERVGGGGRGEGR